MFDRKQTRRSTVLLICTSLVAVLALLTVAGCGKKSSSTSTQPAGSTAKGGLTAARSALSTTAPDAKLLLVQTAQTASTTSTPVWAYLFGSPKSDKTYLVYVAGGKVMTKSEYGTSGLQKSEWSAVPGTDAWQVDSDAAFQKAAQASKLNDATEYQMGMLFYIPRSEAASTTTQPFTWYVSLRSGTSTAAVEVDAKSGKTTVR